MRTTTLALPTFHLNGSSPARVLDDLMEANNAAHTLATAFARCAPNMRDYVQSADVYARARAEFAAHSDALRGILAYLEVHSLHASDAT
jgi:hypothetical protein